MKTMSLQEQEDLLFNILCSIHEELPELAEAMMESMEEQVNSYNLTEEIINEVSSGWAVKKAIGGAVKRFGNLLKAKAAVSQAKKAIKKVQGTSTKPKYDSPIGLKRIRDIEAQERINKQAKPQVTKFYQGKQQKAEEQVKAAKQKLADISKFFKSTKSEDGRRVKKVYKTPNQIKTENRGLDAKREMAKHNEPILAKIETTTQKLRDIQNNPKFTKGFIKGQEKKYGNYVQRLKSQLKQPF